MSRRLARVPPQNSTTGPWRLHTPDLKVRGYEEAKLRDVYRGTTGSTMCDGCAAYR